MSKIRVVMMPVDRAPYITFISDTLENMQKIVGGYIESVRIAKDAAMIVNEEGILRNLPINLSCAFPNIYGDAFFVGVNGE